MSPVNPQSPRAEEDPRVFLPQSPINLPQPHTPWGLNCRRVVFRDIRCKEIKNSAGDVLGFEITYDFTTRPTKAEQKGMTP